MNMLHGLAVGQTCSCADTGPEPSALTAVHWPARPLLWSPAVTESGPERGAESEAGSLCGSLALLGLEFPRIFCLMAHDDIGALIVWLPSEPFQVPIIHDGAQPWLADE